MFISFLIAAKNLLDDGLNCPCACDFCHLSIAKILLMTLDFCFFKKRSLPFELFHYLSARFKVVSYAQLHLLHQLRSGGKCWDYHTHLQQQLQRWKQVPQSTSFFFATKSDSSVCKLS
jgi:hypothetical protein